MTNFLSVDKQSKMLEMIRYYASDADRWHISQIDDETFVKNFSESFSQHWFQFCVSILYPAITGITVETNDEPFKYDDLDPHDFATCFMYSDPIEYLYNRYKENIKNNYGNPSRTLFEP